MNRNTAYTLRKIAAGWSDNVDWTSTLAGLTAGGLTTGLAKALGLGWGGALALGGLTGAGTGLGTHFYRKAGREHARNLHDAVSAAKAEAAGREKELRSDLAGARNQLAEEKALHEAERATLQSKHQAALEAAQQDYSNKLSEHAAEAAARQQAVVDAYEANINNEAERRAHNIDAATKADLKHQVERQKAAARAYKTQPQLVEEQRRREKFPLLYDLRQGNFSKELNDQIDRVGRALGGFGRALMGKD